MTSKMQLHLHRCNRNLKETSWENYLKFLGVLFKSYEEYSVVRALNGHLIAKRWDDLVNLADSISSTTYTTALEHRVLNQIAAVIRKYPFPLKLLSFEPEVLALKIFEASEHKCKRVNQRFRAYDSVRSPHEMALQSAASWISYVLGEINLSSIWNHCDFGPGASVGVNGNATNSARKFLNETWSVTPGAFEYAYASISSDPLFRELLLKHDTDRYYCDDQSVFRSRFIRKAEVLQSNKITFVPKTAKVLRTIAVEPLLNGYIQKGIDEFMRKRLKRVGIDLSDQTINQRLAREGSLSGQSDPFVTIDLSSASDSISIGLCRRLLPEAWFHLMDDVRSKSYRLGTAEKRYQKFTTMGNGFCFPLETLIFASLCHVAYGEFKLKPDFSVYGDDIVVRQSVAARVLQLLGVCGFKANLSKTFLQGPFRESCGADWFEGEDVRPINLDYAFDSIQNVFKFCNLARSKGAWERIFFECFEFLESLIPRDLLFCRPFKGNVDTALEVPWDVFMNSRFSRYHRNTWNWSWLEIRNSAWPDTPTKRFAGYNVALMRGALTGSTSSVPFAVRRKSCTKVSRVSGSGSEATLTFKDVQNLRYPPTPTASLLPAC